MFYVIYRDSKLVLIRRLSSNLDIFHPFNVDVNDFWKCTRNGVQNQWFLYIKRLGHKLSMQSTNPLSLNYHDTNIGYRKSWNLFLWNRTMFWKNCMRLKCRLIVSSTPPNIRPSRANSRYVFSRFSHSPLTGEWKMKHHRIFRMKIDKFLITRPRENAEWIPRDWFSRVRRHDGRT